MSKLILLLVAVVILYALLRKRTVRRTSVSDRAARPAAAESFVTCARCGINVPTSEAVIFEGHHYCCEEHRRLG